MTDETLAGCITLLKSMNSGKEQSWKENATGLRQIYTMVLRPMDDAIGKQAVEWAVLNEEWRPSPAKLRQIAVRIASPYPSDDDAYAEIIDKARNIGLYGMPHPERPNIRLEGPPPMSHPIVSRIIPHLGGWEFLCTGEAQMQEGLKKQVAGSHATVTAQWEQEVAAQLALPPAKRNPVYFRQHKPYRPLTPVTDADYLALPPPPKKHDEEWDESVAVPTPIRALIGCIREKAAEMREGEGSVGSKWSLPSDDQRGQSLLKDCVSRADRERMEAEVRQAQANPKYRMEDVA